MKLKKRKRPKKKGRNMLTNKQKLSVSKLFLIFCLTSSTHTAHSSANFLTPLATTVKQFLDPLADKLSTFIGPWIESAGDLLKTYKLPFLLAALAGYGVKRVIQDYHSSPSSEGPENLTDARNEPATGDTAATHEQETTPTGSLSGTPVENTTEAVKKAAAIASAIPKASISQASSSSKSGGDDDKGKIPTKTVPVTHEHQPKEHKTPDLLSPTPSEQHSSAPQISSQPIESKEAVPPHSPTHFSPFNQGKPGVAFGSQPAASEPSQPIKSPTPTSLKPGSKTVIERYQPANNQKAAPSKKTAALLTHTFDRTVEIAAPPTIKESFLEATHPFTETTQTLTKQQPIVPAKKTTIPLQENLIEHNGIIQPLKDFTRHIINKVKSWFS